MSEVRFCRGCRREPALERVADTIRRGRASWSEEGKAESDLATARAIIEEVADAVEEEGERAAEEASLEQAAYHAWHEDAAEWLREQAAEEGADE